ncbi:MAG: hypothetical protein LWX08_13475 [Deltaproteobacteria bacterium]|jgi:hypothetical protein|nr:hypothetical protein [Deltaproteobacteria bacterium]
MAVEVHMLETAMHLARILNRTVVLPILPILETTNYEKSLEYYFNIPQSFPWISTDQFLRQCNGIIDVLFHVIPDYSPFYTSSIVREIHPVWFDNIKNYWYFDCVGFKIQKVYPCQIVKKLDVGGIVKKFHSNGQAIGITYINGLLDSKISTPERNDNNFALHTSGPTGPSNYFINRASKFIGDQAYTAIHWRRSKTLIQMASRVYKLQLPDLASLYECLDSQCKRLFVASDAAEIENPPQILNNQIIRYYSDSPNENAIMDLALCVLAKHFIGTDISTFSHLISFLRQKAGKEVHSTNLLPSIPVNA